MEKDTKEVFLQIRINKELKEKFTKMLKEEGDTASGYLTRTITKYVRKKEHPESYDERESLTEMYRKIDKK